MIIIKNNNYKQILKYDIKFKRVALDILLN